jgi:peptide/nickel transport system permease protein
MTRLIAYRMAAAVPVLLGVSVVVFLVLYLVPGDPAELLLVGTGAGPERVEEVRQQLGLDRPLVVQYLDYLSHLVRGDLGYSYLSQQSVSHELAIRIGFTIQLAVAAIIVGLAIGVPLGVAAGMNPHSRIDRFSGTVANLGVAIPNFWLATILILVFAVWANWLPALGAGSLRALILPAISLGWVLAGIVARLLRDELIQVYSQPYIEAARAQGLGEWAILQRHAFRNAVGPMVSMVGLQFGGILTGAVAIEVVFGRPGMGSYLVQAIQAKDIPAVQGVVFTIAAAYVIVNLAVDVTLTLLDPRTRAELEARA